MTLVVVLFLLWVLAVVSATTMGGFIHLLLLAAIVLAFWRAVHVSRPRRPAAGS